MRAMIGTIIFFFSGPALRVAFAQSGPELEYKMGMPCAVTEDCTPFHSIVPDQVSRVLATLIRTDEPNAPQEGI